METFLVRLGCRSPYLTPWRNCTLWGRLSWIVADGRLPGWTIADWIDAHRSSVPPLAVSDGFPDALVPVPARFLASPGTGRKPLKALPWADWLPLCEQGTWPQSQEPLASSKVERMHVVIERMSGTALEGGLRTEVGTQPEEILVVAQVSDALTHKGLETLFEELCLEGWGQGRSAGYGHVVLQEIKTEPRPAATGSVATLGHVHPTDDLPEGGWWRWTGVPVRPHLTDSRRGPVESFTTMLLPGATFASDSAVLGRAIDLPDRPDAIHYGVAPTWPVTEVAHA